MQTGWSNHHYHPSCPSLHNFLSAFHPSICSCSTDPLLLSTPEYATDRLLAFARANVFSLRPDAHHLRFSCRLTLCLRTTDGCKGLTVGEEAEPNKQANKYSISDPFISSHISHPCVPRMHHHPPKHWHSLGAIPPPNFSISQLPSANNSSRPNSPFHPPQNCSNPSSTTLPLPLFPPRQCRSHRLDCHLWACQHRQENSFLRRAIRCSARHGQLR